MPNRDGIVSIGFDYKKDLEKMIKDFEAEMNAVSNNTQLSKGMKKQFDNILAEMREFKASMDKELANLGSGKVSQSSFKSFKQTVENKFKGIREDIDRLDLAVATLNDSMGILGKGVDLSKISNDFKNFEDYVTRTNSAVENLIHTLGEQGISLFSFDNRNISDVQSIIRRIDNELKQLDKDTGAEFELFNEKQAQDELNRLSVQLTSTLELMENAKKQMETMDTSTEGFKKVRGEFALLQLKAASLNDTIEMLYEVTESKDMYIEMDDKSLSMYEKYTDELADNLETITSYAKNAKKELSSLLDTQKSPAIKVSSEMNPNSSELSTVVTIDTTSSELWKKLSPIMQDLQGILNSNPVIAPVKLVVAPTAVSSVETGNLDISNSYSKKYAKVLAQTGEDAVVDLEGVYKKTFTSVMDTATSYAKETIGKIQEVFDKNRIGVKFDISQEEIDKIQNFVLSNKDGKKVDISGQITKAKQEVEELNENIEKTAKLLDDTKSKGNVKFDGFDKFTQDVSKSIGKLEELQNILKALQNIEITLAKASGIASITELDNQWANVEKRILNATKLDGSFRKNASVNKIASEYQKYIDMGGTNSIADIDKIKDNKDTLDVIISKAKEFAKQDLSNDSVKELSTELDGIIGKFDELISTVKTATNALYKIIKQTGVSDLDKQWSSISNKFKSIADESGKINLSKQKTDIKELMDMYQKYENAGGANSLMSLTDNVETLRKLDKEYQKLNQTQSVDNSSTIEKESESFKSVEKSVDSLTTAIGDTKVQAINVEATAMEDAAEREIMAIRSILDNLDLVVSRLKDIKGIKLPKIEVKNVDVVEKAVESLENAGNKSNISSGNTTTPSEVKNNEEVASAIRKKKEELASYELQVEELRYEIEKLSKVETNTTKSGFASVLSKKQLEAQYDSITNRIFGEYDAKTGKDGSKKWMALDNLANISENTLNSYRMWQEELQKVGYRLGEIRETSVGLEADILPIDGKAVTNAEEFRRLLSEVSSVPNDNIMLLNSQLSELEGKVSSIKAEIKSLESASTTPIKDVFQGDEASKINEAAEATNNLADAENRLNIVEDKKSAQKYWQGRFKDSISDMTKTNEELVRMKSYYEDLQKETAKLDNSSSLLSALDKYTDTTKYTSEFISRVNSAQSEIKNIDVASPEGLARLKEIDLIVDEIISDSKLLENKLIKQDSKIADIISKMKIFRDSNTNMSKSQRADLQALIDSAEVMAKTGNVTAEAIEHIKIGFSGIKAEVTTTGNTGLKMIDRIVQRAEDMNAKFIAQFFSWQDWIRYLREGFTIIKELDTALVDLKKTTAMNSSQLEEFYFDSNDVAKKMGVTTQAIIEQSSAWSRLGYNTKEASTQMAELSSQFASISPGMDLDTATDGLVSSMKAFDIEVSNVERNIMDNINRIGNTAATSNGEIVDMLTRSSAAMAAANNTIQETIALETAAVEITRNAETTGTAFKTLSMRIRGYDEETEELSDDLKNISGDIADLTKTASTPGGISLFTDETKETYKSTYQILKEISDIYDELSDKNRANNYCPYVQKCA